MHCVLAFVGPNQFRGVWTPRRINSYRMSIGHVHRLVICLLPNCVVNELANWRTITHWFFPEWIYEFLIGSFRNGRKKKHHVKHETGSNVCGSRWSTCIYVHIDFDWTKHDGAINVRNVKVGRNRTNRQQSDWSQNTNCDSH